MVLFTSSSAVTMIPHARQETTQCQANRSLSENGTVTVAETQTEPLIIVVNCFQDGRVLRPKSPLPQVDINKDWTFARHALKTLRQPLKITKRICVRRRRWADESRNPPTLKNKNLSRASRVSHGPAPDFPWQVQIQRHTHDRMFDGTRIK